MSERFVVGNLLYKSIHWKDYWIEKNLSFVVLATLIINSDKVHQVLVP